MICIIDKTYEIDIVDKVVDNNDFYISISYSLQKIPFFQDFMTDKVMHQTSLFYKDDDLMETICVSIVHISLCVGIEMNDEVSGNEITLEPSIYGKIVETITSDEKVNFLKNQAYGKIHFRRLTD